jgi:hypothetical protein
MMKSSVADATPLAQQGRIKAAIQVSDPHCNTRRSQSMPKLNARENTRNRSQAAKRERNRALKTSLNMPAKAPGKHPAKAADNARAAATKATAKKAAK